MKLSEIKHNHSLTDLLKIILFSLLMLAPLLTVAVKCLYVICNKNAHESYTETKTLTNVEQFEYKQYYQYNSNNNAYGLENSYTLYINDINISLNSGYSQLHYDNGTIFYDYLDDSYTITFGTETENEPLLIFTFQYDTEIGIVENYSQYKQIKTNSLDNVFEYSISKLEDNQLFNWTKQTAIFSPTQTMCTQLGITTNVIPQILVYWFLLTIIYVIIDIVIKIFTVLTHMIGSKKA